MSARLWLLAILLSLNVVIAPTRPVDSIWPCACDEAAYWRMSDGDTPDAPFAWRVLYPALVRVMPLEREAAFVFAAHVSLIACGLMVVAILRQRGLSPLWSLVGLLLWHSLHWFAPYLAHNVYLTDGLAMLFALVAIYAALTRNAALFLAALAVGVLAKEAVLFAAPLWVTLATRPTRRTVIHAVVLTLPALTALTMVRSAIPAGGGYSYAALVPAMLRHRVFAPVSLLDYAPFGTLPLLAWFSPRKRDVLVRFAPFIALVYVQLLFAGDTGRLLVWAALPFVIAATDGLRTLLDNEDCAAADAQLSVKRGKIEHRKKAPPAMLNTSDGFRRKAAQHAE